MKHLTWLPSLLILTLIPGAVAAQAKGKDAVILFKDSFVIKGKVHESVREVIYDSSTGRAYSLPSGEFVIDDGVRTIRFAPHHVLKVNPPKDGEIARGLATYLRKSVNPTTACDPNWILESIGLWNEKGERTLVVRTPTGPPKKLTQRIAWITPQYVLPYTGEYKWFPMHTTQEYGPKRTRDFLMYVYTARDDLQKITPGKKFFQIAAFMYEAGWFKEAEEELINVAANFPDEKAAAEEKLVKLRKDRAELLVDSIDKAKKAGQHQEALERLADFGRLGNAKIVSPKFGDKARGLKEDYDKDTLAIEQARKYLKDLSAQAKPKKLWTETVKFIADELNYDTVNRLDEFLLQAKQYERQVTGKLELTHTAEQVLAFAVSSWLQSNKSFTKDTEMALKLTQARTFLLAYLHSDNEAKRARLLKDFLPLMSQSNGLSLDVMTRMIDMIPPPEPHDAKKLDTEVQTIKLAEGGEYLVQLPPEYHHARSYPVLMVCHSGFEAPEKMLKNLSEEAAKNGYILVAPLWAGKKGAPRYQYSFREHKLVLDTLTDLRRRFQVDSDRVFLFGWEEGGKMAFDIGLAHPDQFAGVVPMSGAITPFARKWYWTNAQYLPFYVVEGERNTANRDVMRDLFKEYWTRSPYTSMYVEYRGRTTEWFASEIPIIFNWMSCRKRQMPLKDLGRASAVGGLGEEFRASRSLDNRFYFLSCEAIDPRCENAHTPGVKWESKYRPASFQANLSPGNIFVKGANNAKIWTKAQVRITGLKQVTLWITPDMLGASQQMDVWVNERPQGERTVVPRLETLLEELIRSGDRQRLFVAKIEIKN